MTTIQVNLPTLLIALATVVLIPTFVSIFANLITPRLQDWWASRSRRATEAEIKRLEELLPLEPMSLMALQAYCWKRLFLVLSFALFLGVTFSGANLEPPFLKNIHPLALPEWARNIAWFVLIAILLVPFNIAFNAYLVLRILVDPRLRGQREQNMRSRIEKLKTRMSSP
jgi:hypothetical protein